MRRLLRVFLATGLALLSAVAGAQVRVVPSAALAPLGVPSLLVGTPAAPAPALTAALAVQARTLAALPAPEAAAFLVAQAQSPAPVQRAAALLAAARPDAPADRGVAELAETARRDPALTAWFDGAAPAPSLEVDGLSLKRGSWRSGGKPLDRLGQGEFGFVDVHPAVPGTVIKTVELSAAVLMMSVATPAKSADLEEKTSRALAAADAGPAYLGRTIVGGRAVSVRERVYGDTLDSLASARALGPAERDLVLDLARRLAAAGLKPDDMRPSNIMIGRTLLDPRRRAYLVDGGNLNAYDPALDAEGRFQDLLRTPIVLRGRMDPHMGWVEFSKPLALILEEGLERSSRVTRRERFFGFWKDFFRAMTP